MWRDLWTYNRKLVLTATGVVVVILAAVAVLIGTGGPRSAHSRGTVTPESATGSATPAAPHASSSTGPYAIPSTLAPSEAASIIALPPGPVARLSKQFPAVPAGSLLSPSAYSSAWTQEAFAMDYRHDTRDELLGWAQYEAAPLKHLHGLTPTDEEKVLPSSLTNPATGSISSAPLVPPIGAWVAMRAALATQAVSDIKVVTDQAWEQQVAAGYQPHDPLMTIQDVSATLTLTQHLGSRITVTRTAIAFSLALGTAEHHTGYGTQSTGNYVARPVTS